MKKLALLLAFIILLSSLAYLTSCTQDNTNNPTDLSTETSSESPNKNEEQEASLSYILNKNTKKFHYSDCYAVELMNEENKIVFNGNRNNIIEQGYKPCLKCNPWGTQKSSFLFWKCTFKNGESVV